MNVWNGLLRFWILRIVLRSAEMPIWQLLEVPIAFQQPPKGAQIQQLEHKFAK
jgi:hypothetical protein